jgi:hypothetical protein
MQLLCSHQGVQLLNRLTGRGAHFYPLRAAEWCCEACFWVNPIAGGGNRHGIGLWGWSKFTYDRSLITLLESTLARIITGIKVNKYQISLANYNTGELITRKESPALNTHNLGISPQFEGKMEQNVPYP